MLLSKGNSFFIFPFRVIWMETDEDLPKPAQVAFAVPKKNFKRAVDRNHIKRILRETYRKNKSAFYSSLSERGKKLNILFIFTAHSPMEFAETDAKIILTLQRLIKQIDAAGSHAKKT